MQKWTFKFAANAVNIEHRQPVESEERKCASALDTYSAEFSQLKCCDNCSVTVTDVSTAVFTSSQKCFDQLLQERCL